MVAKWKTEERRDRPAERYNLRGRRMAYSFAHPAVKAAVDVLYHAKIMAKAYGDESNSLDDAFHSLYDAYRLIKSGRDQIDEELKELEG